MLIECTLLWNCLCRIWHTWICFSIPADMLSWTTPDPRYPSEFDRITQERAAVWRSLAPFFASHGYHLYSFHSSKRVVVPPVLPSPSTGVRDEYPWPRRLWKDERDLEFRDLRGCRLWPARTSCGREVMIRIVSGAVPSDELRVYQRLNSVAVREDPRNQTLPILEYLTIRDIVFVVLPRWQCAFECDSDSLPFESASEILDMAETFYEGLQFLHDNRISHRDICDGNAVMNVLLGSGDYGVPDMRRRGSVRYAYIDWDAASIFPEDIDIQSVEINRIMRHPEVALGLQAGMCNPFKHDVRCLSNMLQKWVRVLEDEVPSLGAFFDSILASDDESLPSAQGCLEALRQIRADVSPPVLEKTPRFVSWSNGYLKPLYPQA